MNVLVTGGAGYIGSHTLIELLAEGYSPIVVDNLSNSSKESITRVERITGKKIPFYTIDCMNTAALSDVFNKHAIECVIHFAGLKAVGESVAQPLRYYRNNLDATLTVCEVMQQFNVRKFIFSSSATVYGDPEKLPLDETCRTGIGVTNPYGQTKYMIEQILQDLAIADKSWQICILRYFNPIGAHESGLIGEDPNDIPNNLFPYISQVAVGKLEKVRVFGNDYPTRDGTGIRDYIHVVDLARGHVAALDHLAEPGEVAIYNLGTGKGTSVLESIHAYEEACGKKIPYVILGRRPGDLAEVYADCSKAESGLQWKAKKTVEDACVDAWRWQSGNPNGYRSNSA